MKQSNYNNFETRRIRLVIAIRQDTSIKLESSAIAVRISNKPVARFPLKNLMSIQLIGSYNGSILPFICCAKQGVPVTFFSNRGKLEAILSGKASEQLKLVNWLEYCEFDQEYQTIYKNWLENQIRHLCSTSGISGNCSEKMLNTMFCVSIKYLSKKFNKTTKKELLAWLSGIARTEITLIAADHGVSPASQLSNKLQSDLLPILKALLTALFAGWCKENKVRKIKAELIASFHNEIHDKFKYEIMRMFYQLNSQFELSNK